MASSEFLTNKEQGDWAEQTVFNAINEHSPGFCASNMVVPNLCRLGDDGFERFYKEYQDELRNTIGKRPDLLIFRRADFNETMGLPNDEIASKAIAAIEVRSSSFLANRYVEYMETRTRKAIKECKTIRERLLERPIAALLQQKSPEILKLAPRGIRQHFP